MGILLAYDVTDESSFNKIRNWIRNIEQHTSDNVNKILVGNKVDMDEKKKVLMLVAHNYPARMQPQAIRITQQDESAEAAQDGKKSSCCG